MADKDWISFSCIEVQQPIGRFYIGAINSKDLVRISFADRRTMTERKRDIEIFSGIERPLSERRVAELRKYVKNIDASFPTGIILAIDSKNAKYDAQSSTMSLRNDDGVARIIDGQHRIGGLVGYNNGAFQLNVTMFVDMDMEDQAILFATINLKQAPVTKSLAYDLFDFAESRSPQKTCHNIAKLLNYKEASPFWRRIMILGVATGSPNETLTQAAFIEPLMQYITTDPMSDRDQLKRGNKLAPVTPEQVRVRRLIFRNMFLEDRDAEIARVMSNYFGAVSERWPEAWEGKKAGYVLNRTTGYRALMRFLPLPFLMFGYDAIVPASEFRVVFKKVRLKDDDFTSERFKPGSSGQSELYKMLLRDTGIDEHSPWKGLS